MINVIEYCKELKEFNSAFSDVHNRNIIGRAYYYTYYSAEENLVNRLQWHETPCKGGVHARLHSRLKGYDKKSIKIDKEKLALETFTKITAFKKLRTKVDYKLHASISSNMVDFSIIEAEDIVLKLQSL